MKIRGNGRNVDRLRVTSKSLDIRFDKICKPLNPYDPDAILSEPGCLAEIIFEDSYELDELIDMLERFRDASRGHLGRWERGEGIGD